MCKAEPGNEKKSVFTLKIGVRELRKMIAAISVNNLVVRPKSSDMLSGDLCYMYRKNKVSLIRIG